MKTPFQFKHIRNRFSFWFVSVAIVPLIIATIIIYNQRVEVIKYNQFQKLTSIRDLKVQSLVNWYNERIGDIQSFAQDHELRTFADSVIMGSNGLNLSEIEEIAFDVLNQKVELYTAYQEIFIVDPKTAKITLSTNKSSIGLDKSSYHYYKEPLKTNSVVFTDIYLSRALNNNSGMTFSVPLRCSQHNNEHVTGVLVARIDLDHSLYRMLLNRVGMGETGETLIINKDYFALNDLRHYPDAPLNLKIEAEPAVNAVSGKTGIIEATDYHGEPVLAAYTFIPEIGWGFVAKQDQKEVYSSINAMVVSLLILVLVSILFIYLVSKLLAQITTKPIMDMVDISERVSRGEYSARHSITTVDEVSILARINNELAESIESQLFIRDGLSEISDLLIKHGSLNDLSNNLIQVITKQSNSQMGALYLMNDDSNVFEPIAATGYDINKLANFYINMSDGEFGRALSTKKISHIKDIPENTNFVFKAVAGTVFPREIINIPIIVKYEVVAILALASLSNYSEDVIKLIKQLHPVLNVGLSNILAEEEIRQVASELQDNNQELESLAEELKAQADEVSEQNVELEEQREQVVNANRLKSEFLSNMSHELRTPLNSIISLSKVLQDQTRGDLSEKQTGYLGIVTRNGRILLELINDILDLSKIEAGQLEISLSTLSPLSLVEDLLESVQPLADEKGISLKTNFDANLPKLTTDEFLVHRILQNIISNAIKFTEKGHVLITMKANKDKVFIGVKDTGIGIPEENLPNIFDEFRQVDGTLSRKFEGTGLGLAIAKRSTKLLGGNILVESKLNEGSTFTVELPIKWQGEKPNGNLTFTNIIDTPGSSIVTPANSLSPENIKLILVEDQEPIIIHLNSVLRQKGYQIDVAHDGQEAIDYCQKTIPDGIILDLQMPKVDGFQVLETIRNRKETAHIPVLILTAKELTQKDLKLLSSNNIQQLLQKGDINEDHFLKKVATMLGIEVEVIKPVKKEIKSSIQADSHEEKKSNTNKPTILIIEDNSDNLIAIKAILEPKYSVIEATDGKMGLNLIISKQPAVVLCDVMLPKLDGIALLNTVRADENLKDIPFIAVTAKAMKGDKERILDAGFNAYVTKPINRDILFKKLKDVLKK
ncbi:MAG: response regulator [Candidatus Marinimicrobia bacterium]|nr:response regulator [Candidatus Neomarinimicrobiota bacterium]